MIKDLARVMNLPREEREKAFAEERERILASGSTAKTVLLYLEGYFERSKAAYHTAFEMLPLGAELKNYQVVHQGLNALMNLEGELKREIMAAENVSEPEIEDEDNVNI